MKKATKIDNSMRSESEYMFRRYASLVESYGSISRGVETFEEAVKDEGNFNTSPHVVALVGLATEMFEGDPLRFIFENTILTFPILDVNSQEFDVKEIGEYDHNQQLVARAVGLNLRQYIVYFHTVLNMLLNKIATPAFEEKLKEMCKEDPMFTRYLIAVVLTWVAREVANKKK